MTTDLVDRAAGCLWGLAIGDALGMPTQTLSRADIVRRYGRVDSFLPGPSDHPLAAGLPAGHVTDDTEQALLLARLLGPDASLDELAWANALIGWEDTMRARGSHDLLGPSTRRALDALRAGVPASEAGRAGDTNGGAMRIAPVGIAVSPDDLELLVDRVVDATRLTHGTSLGLAGAAAVAAAVSVALEAGSTADVMAAAVTAARLGAERGRWVAGGRVADRIEWAVGELQRGEPGSRADALDRVVGTSLAANESVPAALALAVIHAGDPWAGVCAAASAGGDCDTIAAMTGAILGAATGLAGLPGRAVESVRRVNDLGDLEALAARLVEIRSAT